MSTSELQQRVVRRSPSRGAGGPNVWGIYEPTPGRSSTSAPIRRRRRLIDAAWNFGPKHYRFSTESMDQVLDLVRDEGMTVEWVLDTHLHADHNGLPPHVPFLSGGGVHVDRLGLRDRRHGCAVRHHLSAAPPSGLRHAGRAGVRRTYHRNDRRRLLRADTVGEEDAAGLPAAEIRAGIR